MQKTNKFPEASVTPAKSSVVLVMRAYVALVWMDLHLAVRGFPSLHRAVKRTRIRSGVALVEEMCHAVDLACVFYFKQVLCLQRSAATTTLLRHQGVAAEMVIGVQQSPFRAHAWVEVTGEVVNDKPYTPGLYKVMDRC